jgi:hypothetical protein
MFDAVLAQRLRDAARPLPVEPPRQERPAPRREAFQYD